MSTPETYLPFFFSTVTVTDFVIFPDGECAVILTSFDWLKTESPASRPLITPVFGSTDATVGSEEDQTMSEVSPASGLTSTIES